VIIAAGLSPAWQTVMQFGRLRPGEVNRATHVMHYGSGKVLNVAVALAHLESPVTTISPIGGPARDAIDREFSVFGISRHWVLTQSSTRACVTVLDEATGLTTELVENVAPLSSDEHAEFLRIFAHEAPAATLAVLTGSLAQGTPVDYYRQLLQASGTPVILDARGPELLAALDQRPLLVKPNRDELSTTLGQELDYADDVWQAMQQLVERGAQNVLVTSGTQPALLCHAGQRYLVHQAVAKPTVNPIGCGDCLAAGIAASLARNQSLIEAVRFGMAVAAENATQLLAARIDPAKVAARVTQVRIERV
jgi:1-phosphofructokinase family hexose kinase